MEWEHINGMGLFVFPSLFLELPLTTKSVDKRFSRRKQLRLPISHFLMIKYFMLTQY